MRLSCHPTLTESLLPDFFSKQPPRYCNDYSIGAVVN
ncbi:hypothetical protein EVA_20270 [gut metagenome]|uniref:Uncharacterized protein n=1 Tax=gut metagenome TaxID=749906 RepID=J9F9Q0_9ZZZZ